MATRTIAAAAGVFLLWSAAGGPCAHAAIFHVGPGRDHTLPSQVFADPALQSGDTILIDAGDYTDDYTPRNKPVGRHNLLIRGVGDGRARMVSTLATPNEKAIWVIGGTNTTIENCEFAGCRLPASLGGNGAGIRLEGATLTLRNCLFSGNDNGILVNAGDASDILFESCEFSCNGYPGTDSSCVGRAHNIYVGNVRSFTMRGCYSHSALGEGHLVKSRARSNHILCNRLTEENDGRASYQLQLAEGGLSFVIGNLIEQGPGAANRSRIVCFADENQNNPVQSLFFANNTVVNDYGGSPGFVFCGGPAPSGKVVNNLFIGAGTPVQAAGTALVVTNNLHLPYAARTQLVNSAAFDYRLIPTADAIDAGIVPGVHSNVDLAPVCEYVHPLACAARPVEWKLDVGAYESTDATGDRNGDGIEDNWQRRFFGTLANPCAAPGHTNVNGYTTLQCFLAGLVPTNAGSRLAIRSLVPDVGRCLIVWQGGTSVWQHVECSPALGADAAWRVVHSRAPALVTTNSVLLEEPAARALFFRIRVGGP